MVQFLQIELEFLQQHTKNSNSSSMNTSELIKKFTSWQKAKDFINCINEVNDNVLKHIEEAKLFY